MILVILCISMIQVGLMPYFSFGQAVGNLILIMMIIFIFKREYEKAILWALVGGFILDISQGIIGPYTVSFLINFFILYFVQEKILQVNSFIFVLATVLIASILLDMFYLLIIFIIGEKIGFLIFWPIILKQAAVNTLLAGVIYSIYYYFDKRLFPKSEIKLPEVS